MREPPSSRDPGEPALRIVGFRLWVHGREFPGADDEHDGNWLRVTAHCEAPGASIRANGSFLMVGDIERFAAQCEALHGGNASTAMLEPLEPDLHVTIEPIDRLGHLAAHVALTPDHLAQSHRVTFEIDQSFLPAIIAQCRRIVDAHPVRGRDRPRAGGAP